MRSIRSFAFACLTLVVSLGPVASRADDFTFDGKQLQYSFTLKDTESHTVYQDEQEPDTCYQTVQQGFDTQCHTEYDQQCHTETDHECHDVSHQECTPSTHQECHDVSHQECTPTTHQECHDEYQQECHEESHQECTPESHQVCSPVQHCESVPHQECHTEGTHQVCQTVEQQECHEDQECHTETSQSCHEVSQQVCSQVPHQVCQQVPGQDCHDVHQQQCAEVPFQDCHDVSQQVCADVPKQVCQQIPKQVCEQVPHMVQQSYACTKTVSVPVGTALDYNVTGNIAVAFQAPPAGEPAPNESFTIGFSSEDASFEVKQDSKQYLILSQKTESTAVTAPQQKVTTAKVDVSLLSVADYLAPVAGGIKEIAADSADVLTFTIGKVTKPELLALSLTLTSSATATNDDPTVFYNGPVDASNLTLTPAGDRTQVSIPLTQLKLSSPILAGTYSASLTVAVKADSLAGLLNPDAVPSAAQSQVQAQASLRLNLEVTPENAKAIILPITVPIADVEYNNDLGSLSFELAPVTFPQFLEMSLSLTIQGSTEAALFSGVVDPSTVQFADADDGNTLVSIDVSKVKPKLALVDGNYAIVVTVRLKREALPGQIDPSLLPATLQLSAATTGTLRTPQTLDSILAPTKGPIDQVAINVTKDQLSFRIPRVLHPSTLAYQLKLTRKQLLLFNHTLYDGAIDLQNVTIQDDVVDGKSLVTVDLSNVGLDEALKAQQYEVQLTVGINPEALEQSIDPSQIPSSAQAKVDVKVQATATAPTPTP